MLDSAIIVLMITSSKDLVFGLSKLIAKSKCSEFSCCGCSVKRDVALEAQEEEFAALHPRQPLSPD